MAELKRDADAVPLHPGELLREDVLPALGISVSEAARLLGISRQTLHAILAEKAAVTPEMAVRLGKFCGNGAQLWVTLQSTYDLWHAERAVDTSGIPTPRAA